MRARDVLPGLCHMLIRNTQRREKMSDKNEKTHNDYKAMTDIARNIKDVSIAALSEIADAVKKVAPVLWRAVRLKIVADAVALCFVTTVLLVVMFKYWSGNTIIISVVCLVAALPFAGALKRIIASDFFALMEIIDLARAVKKD